MGVTWVPSLSAWNFALYSRRASSVTLLLYSADDPIKPVFEQRLNPRINKSGRIWHCWVARGSRASQRHTTRIAWMAATIPARATVSILRKFCSIRSLPPFISRRLSTASPTALPGPTDGRAPLGVLPRSAPQPGKLIERAAAPCARSDRLRTSCQGFHGARQLGREPPETAARSPGSRKKFPI